MTQETAAVILPTSDHSVISLEVTESVNHGLSLASVICMFQYANL